MIVVMKGTATAAEIEERVAGRARSAADDRRPFEPQRPFLVEVRVHAEPCL